MLIQLPLKRVLTERLVDFQKIMITYQIDDIVGNAISKQAGNTTHILAYLNASPR